MVPAMPKLAIREMGSIGEDAEVAGQGGTGRSDCRDWYDLSYDEIENTKLAAAMAAVPRDKHFAISTPRLTIVSMATPRDPAAGAAAAAAAVERAGRQAYVPHWPYSSQWPFCRAPTTLELRGLPRSLTAQCFIAQLDSWGLASRCDFVHLQKAGRAVVNAMRHADGRELAGRLHGFSAWECCEEEPARPCKVAWSFYKQGLEELLCSFQQQLEGPGQVWHSNGCYTGPWASFYGSWMPVVQPPEDEETAWVPIGLEVN